MLTILCSFDRLGTSLCTAFVIVHPRRAVCRHSSSTTTTTTTSTSNTSKTALALAKKKGRPKVSEGGNPFEPDPTQEALGPFLYVVPILTLLQISFLTAAKLTSGPDNLTLYGELGNAYIRTNNGYGPEKSLLERQSIASKGQSIWFKNVVRDLQNGGPVKPPIRDP